MAPPGILLRGDDVSVRGWLPACFDRGRRAQIRAICPTAHRLRAGPGPTVKRFAAAEHPDQFSGPTPRCRLV